MTPDDFMDTLLKIGLYLGAVFQLICIAAVIVVPEKLTDSTVKVRDVLHFNFKLLTLFCVNTNNLFGSKKLPE